MHYNLNCVESAILVARLPIFYRFSHISVLISHLPVRPHPGDESSCRFYAIDLLLVKIGHSYHTF